VHDSNVLRSILDSVPGLDARRKPLGRLWRDWIRFVRDLERGYELSIDDYTNDLCVRDQIEYVVAATPAYLAEKLRARLRPWEERFMDATRQTRRPLLPSVAGESLGYWWSRAPRVIKDEFEQDLREGGYVF
jgi:hypothetical protein